jgi:hypothetical protein
MPDTRSGRLKGGSLKSYAGILRGRGFNPDFQFELHQRTFGCRSSSVLYLCGFESVNCMTAAYGVKLRPQEVVQYATSRTARGDHCWAQQTRLGEPLRLLSCYGRVRASMGTSCGVS